MGLATRGRAAGHVSDSTAAMPKVILATECVRGTAGATAATGDDQYDGSIIVIVMPLFLFMLVYMIAATVAVCYLAKRALQGAPARDRGRRGDGGHRRRAGRRRSGRTRAGSTASSLG
eukprot:2077804-Pyramimonas_sp.AAC.1